MKKRYKIYIRVSHNYKYVYLYYLEKTNEYKWVAALPQYKWSIYCDSERLAAIEVDKKLIQAGKEPKNILKNKQG